MKSKTLIQSSLCALGAFAFVAIAAAQDQPQNSPPPGDNPPSPSLEAPSSLRDTSPTPTATPEKSSTPAPESTPKPSAAASSPAKSASPSPERKRAARSEADEEETTTTSSRGAAMNMGPDRGSPESNVKRLENQWEGAVKTHDVAFLQTRVAEDFIGVSSRGKRLNKSSLIKDFKTDSDTYVSAKNSALVLRVIDKDVVVVSGLAREVGRSGDSKAFNRAYIFTDTWAMRGDRWQCVASHVMLQNVK